MQKRPPYSEVSIQPGERFLASIGKDYWNTESSARRVAKEAEKMIFETIAQLSAVCQDVGDNKDRSGEYISDKINEIIDRIDLPCLQD